MPFEMLLKTFLRSRAFEKLACTAQYYNHAPRTQNSRSPKIDNVFCKLGKSVPSDHLSSCRMLIL